MKNKKKLTCFSFCFFFFRIQSITPVKPVLFYLTFSAQISINFAWLSVATAAQFFVLMKHLNIQIHPMAAPIATILLTVLNLALAFQFKCVPILVTMVSWNEKRE